MDPWPFGTSRLPRSARDRDPGQIDREDTARARHVAHSNFASVQLHAGSADSEAKPESRAIDAALLERAKERVDLSRGQATALILDVNKNAIGGRMRSKPHASVLWSELEC